MVPLLSSSDYSSQFTLQTHVCPSNYPLTDKILSFLGGQAGKYVKWLPQWEQIEAWMSCMVEQNRVITKHVDFDAVQSFLICFVEDLRALKAGLLDFHFRQSRRTVESL
jgi:hypothetical protein